MAVSDETIDFLGQVKKGKPRKFVMLTVGAKVAALVLYKSGNSNKQIAKAKQESKGTPCFGVVEGQGQDLTFKIAVSDGFKSAPVANTALKTFLKDEADISCKPIFEVVETAPLVLDDDHPVVVRFRRLQTAAIKACEANPSLADEISDLCLRIGTDLDQDQIDQAVARLDGLETLLASAVPPNREEPAVPNPNVSVDPASSIEQQKATLADALKKIKPLVDRAIEAAPNRKGEVLQAIGQVANQIRQGEFNDAKNSLLAAAALARELIAGAQAPVANEVNRLQEQFESAKARLEPRLMAAGRADPAKATPLMNVWNYALDQAEAENYKSAVAALERLEVAVEKTLREAPVAANQAAASAQPASEPATNPAAEEFERESARLLATINAAASEGPEIGGADVLATRVKMETFAEAEDWLRALEWLRKAHDKATRVSARKPFLVAKLANEPKIKAAAKIKPLEASESNPNPKDFGAEVKAEWDAILDVAKRNDFEGAATRITTLARRIDGEIADAMRGARDENKRKLAELKGALETKAGNPEALREVAQQIFANTQAAEKLGIDTGEKARMPFVEEPGNAWTAALCERAFVDYDWFALKKCRKQGRITLSGIESGFKDDDMWKLVQYRGKVVNELIDGLRTKYPTLIAKASGSEDIESDIDITFATPGSGDDVKAAQEFNAAIKTRFKKPPGRVFDVNIYPRDYGAIKESFKPDYNVDALKDESLDEPEEAESLKLSKIDQDVATLLKQRRFLEQGQFDKMLESLLAEAPEETRDRIRKQYEEGEEIFLLTSLEKVAKIRGQVDLNTLPKEEAAKLNKHLAELDTLKGAGGVEAAARVQQLVPEILDMFEHSCPADTMDVTDALYLEKMGTLRQDQDSIRSLKNDKGGAEQHHPGQTCEEADHDPATHDEWRRKRLNGLEVKVKKDMFTNIIFANEAIMSQGALKHVVEALQAKTDEEKLEKLGKLTAGDLMQSVNEQVADLYKEMKHYEGEVEHADGIADEGKRAAAQNQANGEGFVHASKYLFRLLDAALSLQMKYPDQPSVKAPYSSVRFGGGVKTLPELKARIDEVLLQLRKSAAIPPEVKGEVGALEMREILPDVTDIKSFRTMISNFAIELNKRVRALEEFKQSQQVATEAERAAEKGYFEAAVGEREKSMGRVRALASRPAQGPQDLVATLEKLGVRTQDAAALEEAWTAAAAALEQGADLQSAVEALTDAIGRLDNSEAAEELRDVASWFAQANSLQAMTRDENLRPVVSLIEQALEASMQAEELLAKADRLLKAAAKPAESDEAVAAQAREKATLLEQIDGLRREISRNLPELRQVVPANLPDDARRVLADAVKSLELNDANLVRRADRLQA